jgi:phospholipid/cholesterol/gamma-HCH transport system substrate-binding protein
MKNSLETRLGIFVAMTMIATFLVLEMVGSFDTFKSGIRIHALFNNVQELKVGDPVKMAGVPIGRVDEIGFEASKVKVVMKLRKKVSVKTSSKAAVRFTGLMGQNYVALDFGTATDPDVMDGNLLASVEQPDLNALVAKLDNVATGVENLTKTFTGDKIDNLLGPITDFLKQNSTPLSETISNINVVTGNIAQGKGTVGRLINEDALYVSAQLTVSNLQIAADEARLTLGEARKIVDEVNAGQGTIGKLVKDETLYREVSAAAANLREIMEKVNKGEGTAARIINDPGLYKNANLTLQKLDKATESLEDQGVLSVLGIAVGRLF